MTMFNQPSNQVFLAFIQACIKSSQANEKAETKNTTISPNVRVLPKPWNNMKQLHIMTLSHKPQRNRAETWNHTILTVWVEHRMQRSRSLQSLGRDRVTKLNAADMAFYGFLTTRKSKQPLSMKGDKKLKKKLIAMQFLQFGQAPEAKRIGWTTCTWSIRIRYLGCVSLHSSIPWTHPIDPLDLCMICACWFAFVSLAAFGVRVDMGWPWMGWEMHKAREASHETALHLGFSTFHALWNGLMECKKSSR